MKSFEKSRKAGKTIFKTIKACLEALKKFNYLTRDIKEKNGKTVEPRADERAVFLKNVQKFKKEISEKEKTSNQNVNANLPVDKDLKQE